MRTLLLVAATVLGCSAPLVSLEPAGSGSPDTGTAPATLDGGTADAGPTVTRGVRLSAHWDHTCRIDAQGALSCWGANYRGQLGDGTTEERLEAVGIAGRWREVSAGVLGTCAIDTDGALWCWGSTGPTTRPTRIGDQNDWEQVAAGPGLGCGLRAGGTLWCWGNLEFVNLEFGSDGVTRGYEPTQIPGTWRTVDMHWYRTVAINDAGAMTSFVHDGRDRSAAALFAHPATIDTSQRWRGVRVGVMFSYPIAVDGSVWRLPHMAGSWTRLDARAAWPTSASAGHTVCVLEDSGAIACSDRSYADPGEPLTHTPGPFVSVASHNTERCAVDAEAATWCWEVASGVLRPPARRVP